MSHRRKGRALRRRYGRSGKPLDERYYKRHRLAKWNVEPNVLIAREGPLTRRVFPEMSKSDHEHAARAYADRAASARRAYQTALNAAIAQYGDVRGTPTSGIYNPDFPEHMKDHLRALLADVNDCTDASVAHWAAAGKRTPWRVALAGKAGI